MIPLTNIIFQLNIGVIECILHCLYPSVSTQHILLELRHRIAKRECCSGMMLDLNKTYYLFIYLQIYVTRVTKCSALKAVLQHCPYLVHRFG